MRIAGKTWSAALFVLTAWLVPIGTHEVGAETVLELKEYLGRDWSNEFVEVSVSEGQWKLADEGRALVNAAGETVLWQITGDDKERKIAFRVDLPAFGAASYRFADSPANVDTGLVISENDPQIIRIANACTGVAIRKQLTGNQGPIAGIKLASGNWIGESRWTLSAENVAYTAKVTAQGPVFAEISCVFANNETGLNWRLRFRVFANEPVVLVEEWFDAGSANGSMHLALSPGLEPDNLFYRLGRPADGVSAGGLKTRPLAGLENPVFHLEPWFHWWQSERRYTWVSLFRDQKPDLLMLGLLNPGRWVDPERRRNKTQPPTDVIVTKEQGELVAMFPLVNAGERSWMLAALDKDTCLAPLRKETPDLYKSCVPHRYLVKHGDFPLDMVKDYVLRWESAKKTYPRLFLSPEDLTSFRERYEPNPEDLAYCLKNKINRNNMDRAIQYYLATRNEELGQKIADLAVTWTQDAADLYIKQDSLLTLGYAPHHQTQVLTSATLADVALSTGLLSPEMVERLKAQFAFIGYTVSRTDYWSPERGYSANPNMTTTVAAYKCAIGCLLPEHPLAAAWVADAMTELKDVELDTWSDDNGGWLEAPHYAMASYDYMAGCFLMTHNAGFNEYLFDPKMKKVIEWFAKISTPPDSRINGMRHHPPIGNTYLFEPTSDYGLMAYLWREHDPEFSAHMQWMHRQSGSYPEPGIGGFHPTLAGYREILSDPNLPERAPSWKSEIFPETGVILRHGFPGPAETQLHLITGRNHAHYDYDSGAVTIWGKGRIIADDFGYYGRAPAEDHNLVDAPIAGNGEMNIDTFTPSERFDYVSGRKQGWTRQIAFVKDRDPLGPNYFVINDGFLAPTSGHWRLWLTADKVTPQGNAVHVSGGEDVDTDIFFARPASPALSTSNKTRRSASGLKPDMKWGPLESTQTGLIATLKNNRAVTTVIFPRKEDEPVPECTALAGGKVIRIESSRGTDYVFLDTEPFTFEKDNIRFEGTVGCVQFRDDKPVLSLGSAGRIAVDDQVIENGRIINSSRNAFPDGEFSSAEQTVFPSEHKVIAVTRAEEPLNESGALRKTPGCAVLAFPGDFSHIRSERDVYIDPVKTYRVGMTVKTDAEITCTIGGYSRGNSGKHLMRDDGKHTWEWRFAMHGPTEGWQRLECTIGPKGSGADYIWPNDILSTFLQIFFHGDAGEVHVDSIVFKPVD